MSLCSSKVAYIQLEGTSISTENPFLNWIIYGGMSETGTQNDDDNNDRLTVSKWQETKKNKSTKKAKQKQRYTYKTQQKWQQKLFRTFFTNRIIKNGTEQNINKETNSERRRKKRKKRHGYI